MGWLHLWVGEACDAVLFRGLVQESTGANRPFEQIDKGEKGDNLGEASCQNQLPNAGKAAVGEKTYNKTCLA